MDSPSSNFIHWCRGRSVVLRLPVLVYFAYVGWRQYQEPYEYVSYFSAINLCIHEGGHLLMRPFGDGLFHTAGGTLAQIAAPITCLILLVRQGEYFGIPVCLGWLSTNLINIGVYMADARARELPLVTAEGGDGITGHDWNWLFSYYGLLAQDTQIGLATRGAGSVVMVLALAIGVVMLGLMLVLSEREPTVVRRRR